MNGAPRVGSLFTGIGGLDLGLERAGFDIAWMCEADEWCRRVIAKHWPGVHCYTDVRDITQEAPPVDVLCGGFPCQPVSFAGKGLAQADERWLWPEVARLVRALRPRVLIVENVPGLLARGVGDVLGDLAACGYDAEWDCIPAAAVGAPHRRDRVWIVAYPDGAARKARSSDRLGAKSAPESGSSGGQGRAGRTQNVANAEGESVGTGLRASESPEQRWRRSSHSGRASWEWWATEPDVGRVAHGIPHRVDRLRGLGNAVVPPVAEHIGRRVMETLHAAA